MSDFVAHTAAGKCPAPDFRLLHPQSHWAHAERPLSLGQLPASTIACTMSDQSKCCQCTRHRTDPRPPGICLGPSHPWNRNRRPKNTPLRLREEARAKSREQVSFVLELRCHPCARAMVIFSVSFQSHIALSRLRRNSEKSQIGRYDGGGSWRRRGGREAVYDVRSR